MARQKADRWTTPACEAVWPRVQKPDFKFKKEKGEYSTKLILSAEQAEEWQDRCQALLETKRDAFIDEKPARKRYEVHLPITEEEDDNGDLTGRFLMKTTAPGKIFSKKTDQWYDVKIDVFDAQRERIVNEVKMASGTVLKVIVEPYPWVADGLKKMGVTLRMIAVQVIDLVEFAGQESAESYGFAEEEGFSASTYDFDTKEPAPVEGAEDASEDDEVDGDF